MLKIYNPNATHNHRIGISSIATFQPDVILPNAWFEALMARKFEKHTGIAQRAISSIDEVELGLKAIEKLETQSRFDRRECAAIVFVTPSSIPQSVARQHLSPEAARAEQPMRMAKRFAQRLGCAAQIVIGMNGFCSGYAKAMQAVREKVLSQIELTANQTVLVITSSRISRITDFEDRQAGALFGDFSSATLLARCDSAKYPVHLELMDAQFERKAVSRPYFNFASKENVLAPTDSGERHTVARRLVFTLDGMGIADTAPRAMADAARKMAENNEIDPSQVDCMVPHQAGTGIVRLTGMKLDDAGFEAKPINGLTGDYGNVSSGSVPLALQANWSQLHGSIFCPVAAVGAPGKPEVSQGCIYLRGPDQTTQLKAA